MIGHDDSHEYRRAKRREVERPVDVINAVTEETIGRIGNLSASGMLLISDRPLFDDALYIFRFALLDRTGHEREIEVGSHQLWTEEASAPGQFWSGLRFIDIAREDSDFLRLWAETPEHEPL